MAAMNAFERLPLELLQRLYAYLDTADQLRLRLVCKALRNATGRVLVANGTRDGDAVRIMTGVCLWPAGAQPDVLARLADVIATRGDAGPPALVAARFERVDLVELTVRQADVAGRADVLASIVAAAVRARNAAVLSLLLPLDECARLPLVDSRQPATGAADQRRWAGVYAAVLRSLVAEDELAVLAWFLDDFGAAARMRPPSVFLQALPAAPTEAATRLLWRCAGGVTEANVQVAQRTFRSPVAAPSGAATLLAMLGLPATSTEPAVPAVWTAAVSLLDVVSRVSLGALARETQEHVVDRVWAERGTDAVDVCLEWVCACGLAPPAALARALDGDSWAAYLKRAMRRPTSEALYQWAVALASSAAPELRSQAVRMWANRPHYEPAPPPAVTSVRPAEAWQVALAAIDVDATALVQAFLDAAAHPPAERQRVYAYRADVLGGRYKGCDHYVLEADAVHFLRFLAYFGDATACVVDILASANDDALQLLMNAPSAESGGILSSANVYEAALRLAHDPTDLKRSQWQRLLQAIPPCK